MNHNSKSDAFIYQFINSFTSNCFVLASGYCKSFYLQHLQKLLNCHQLLLEQVKKIYDEKTQSENTFTPRLLPFLMTADLNTFEF